MRINLSLSLIVGKNKDLRRLDISTPRIKDDNMTVKKAVKDLGVTNDCTPSFKEQASQVVGTAGCHLRNLSLSENTWMARP